ncbi:MAG: IclR family transcriptional regulator [Granulosicoccus sp.]|nr:IclR family transcriptional regulator [Granulosicoccus sp.]
MSDAKSALGAPPVERAFQLLRYIGEGNNCSNISLAARESGINRTTMMRLLETLKQQRMIEVDGHNGFVLGSGLIHLASKALQSRDVVSVAQPQLKKLAASLGLSAHLGVIESTDILYLSRETPNLHLVSNVRVGSRLPVHATTIGRIILAFKTRKERTDLLKGVRLARVTEKTATSVKQLNAQVDRDRERGIAWSEGNYEPAIGSAAVAVFDASRSVVAAINVTGPVGEFLEAANRREQIHAELAQAALTISTQLGFIPEPEQVSSRSGEVS